MVSQELDDDDGVARAWGGGSIRYVLGALAALYLGALLTEAAKSGTSARWLPPPLAYFTQVAALFPGAARHATDYRVEGFRCRDRTFGEIDVRPWFRIDADNKESRFYRAMHFYGEHPHRQTLRALEDYIVTRWNADAVDAAARGEVRDALGGVRFVRVQVPVGAPGDHAERYERKPLWAYPADERKDLYYTPASRRAERCGPIGAIDPRAPRATPRDEEPAGGATDPDPAREAP
jgi:hypothetical protein